MYSNNSKRGRPGTERNGTRRARAAGQDHVQASLELAIIVGRAGASPPSRTTGARCLYMIRGPDTV